MGGDAAQDLAAPIDGRSLLPHLNDQDGHNEVMGEYLAEGAVAPMVMIRRGSYKFIHAPGDPDQLYDLAADPDERLNRAEELDHAGLVAEFRAEVAQRWNLAAIDRAVCCESQSRRRLVDAALTTGATRPWDFQPFRDASRQYMRNTVDLDDLEAMSRFPRVQP